MVRRSLCPLQNQQLLYSKICACASLILKNLYFLQKNPQLSGILGTFGSKREPLIDPIDDGKGGGGGKRFNVRPRTDPANLS